MINTGMADPGKLKQEIRLAISKTGHNGQCEITVMGGAPRYSAHTTIVDKKIEMKLDPDQSNVQGAIHAFCRKKGLVEPVIELGKCLGRHETAHTDTNIGGSRFGCPGTIENHYEHFVEEIIRAFEEKGKPVNTGQVQYISNLIEDLIANYALQKEGPMHGDMLFMYDQGGPYNRIYEAYAKLYCFINGQKEWVKLLSRFFRNDDVTNRAVSGIVKDLGIKRGKCDMLMNIENWRQIAYTMAKHLVDLIETDEKGNMVMIAPPGGVHAVEEVPEGSGYRRYTEGRTLPRYMKAEDALWDIYFELAGRLDVSAEGETRDHSYPLIPVTFEAYDPQRHVTSDIDPFRPVFDGDLQFGVASQMHEISFPLREKRRNYPKLNIAMLDRSQSMLLGISSRDGGSTVTIPWGDRSRYHYLCLGVSAIVKGAYERGILEQLDFGGIFFAKTSSTVHGLEKLKRSLMIPQFQGETNFNIGSIMEMLSDDPSVFMTISDGEIWNWEDVRRRFIDIMRTQYYFHIQLGEETDMTDDLKDAGLHILSVRNGDELARKMQQVTLKIMEEHSQRGDY